MPVKWERYGLPEEIQDRTFLDVGCWEADECVEALRRGAARAVGVDLCTSEGLRANVAKHDIEFIQMDVSTRKLPRLGTFDLVFCSGLLYHLEDPMGLLHDLRAVTGRLLVLESAITTVLQGDPAMLFVREEVADDPSTWWLPNKAAVAAMLEAAGFVEVRTAWELTETRRPGVARLAVHASPGTHVDPNRLLPRRPQLMSVEGGDRR